VCVRARICSALYVRCYNILVFIEMGVMTSLFSLKIRVHVNTCSRENTRARARERVHPSIVYQFMEASNCMEASNRDGEREKEKGGREGGRRRDKKTEG
jgi:hypothetical protein